MNEVPQVRLTYLLAGQLGPRGFLETLKYKSNYFYKLQCARRGLQHMSMNLLIS